MKLQDRSKIQFCEKEQLPRINITLLLGLQISGNI